MDLNFRRKRGQLKWHYCQNCREWPESDYESHAAPSGGDVCWECHSLDRAGGCLYKASEDREDGPDAPAHG